MKRRKQIILRLPANYKVEIAASNNLDYPYIAILKFPDKPSVEIHLLYEQLMYTNPNSSSEGRL